MAKKPSTLALRRGFWGHTQGASDRMKGREDSTPLVLFEQGSKIPVESLDHYRVWGGGGY